MFVKTINNIEIHQYPRCSVCVLTHFDCQVRGKTLNEGQTLLDAEAWASRTFTFLSPRMKRIRQGRVYNRLDNTWESPRAGG